MNADELPHDVLIWCAVGAWALLAVVWLVLHWIEDDRHGDWAPGDDRRVRSEDVFTKGSEDGTPDHDVQHERVEHDRHERNDHNSHGIHAGRVRPYPVMPSPGGPIPSVIERLDRWEGSVCVVPDCGVLSCPWPLCRRVAPEPDVSRAQAMTDLHECDRWRYRRHIMTRLRRWWDFRRDMNRVVRLARRCNHD